MRVVATRRRPDIPDPHVDQMAETLHIVGEDWGRKQKIDGARKADLRRQLGGERDYSFQPTRRYRMEHAYHDGPEKKFLERNKEFFTHRPWERLPASFKTRRNRTRLFGAVARGSSMANRIRQMHSNYPFKLCGTIRDRGLARVVNGEAGCRKRLDPWGRGFVRSHRGDVSTKRAQVDLTGSQVNMREDTVTLEIKHGHDRRYIVSRSNQAPALDLGGLNANVIDRHVKGDVEGSWKGKRHGGRKRKAKGPPPDQAAAKKKRAPPMTSETQPLGLY